MPAPIVGGVLNFLKSEFNVDVWDGVVPRIDAAGNPIVPSAATSSDWPAIMVDMTSGPNDEPMDRDGVTFEDSYSEHGPITVTCWGSTREQLEDNPTNPMEPGLLSQIEQAMLLSENWPSIILGANYSVQAILLTHWGCWLDKDQVRLQKGQILYRGELIFDVKVDGVVPTR